MTTERVKPPGPPFLYWNLVLNTRWTQLMTAAQYTAKIEIGLDGLINERGREGAITCRCYLRNN